jgi:hypothetical protein
VRLLVHTDYVFVRDVDGNVWADSAFARFSDDIAKKIDVVNVSLVSSKDVLDAE